MSRKDDFAYEEYQERIRSEQVPGTLIFHSQEERKEHERKMSLYDEINALFEKKRHQETLSLIEEERFQELIGYFKPQEH